jgi:hypothetical protein
MELTGQEAPNGIITYTAGTALEAIDYTLSYWDTIGTKITVQQQLKVEFGWTTLESSSDITDT